MWFTRRPVVTAILLSFGVYLLPLVGPHSFTFLGEGLFQELTGRGERSALWIVSDVGTAVALQLAAWGLLYWFFRRPRVALGLILMGAVPVFIVIAQFAYLIAIPSAFLIEKDEAPESGAWPPVCTVEDASIVSIAAPYHRTGESIDEVLIQSSQGRYQLMRIADCETVPLALPEPTVSPGGRVDFMLSLTYMVPGRALLFNKWETGPGTMNWAVLRRNSVEPVQIEMTNPSPILSRDGEWIGWIERDSGPNAPGSILLIRRLAESQVSFEIDLSRSGERGIPTLIEFDVEARQAFVSMNDAFITVDFAGEIVETVKPAGAAPQPQTFLKTSEGWIAWDAYQERNPYRVVWQLPGGSGSHRVLLGRNINSIQTNPAGTLIAVSVTSSLNIGQTPDSVYVLRASDGSEVFRRYLPRYSRTQTMFAGDKSFVYSSEGKTHVLRVVL